ncbi:hypothetical protein Tco_0825476 [Tanacetum coccineum]
MLLGAKELTPHSREYYSSHPLHTETDRQHLTHAGKSAMKPPILSALQLLLISQERPYTLLSFQTTYKGCSRIVSSAHTATLCSVGVRQMRIFLSTITWIFMLETTSHGRDGKSINIYVRQRMNKCIEYVHIRVESRYQYIMINDGVQHELDTELGLCASGTSREELIMSRTEVRVEFTECLGQRIDYQVLGDFSECGCVMRRSAAMSVEFCLKLRQYSHTGHERVHYRYRYRCDAHEMGGNQHDNENSTRTNNLSRHCGGDERETTRTDLSNRSSAYGFCGHREWDCGKGRLKLDVIFGGL